MRIDKYRNGNVLMRRHRSWTPAVKQAHIDCSCGGCCCCYCWSNSIQSERKRKITEQMNLIRKTNIIGRLKSNSCHSRWEIAYCSIAAPCTGWTGDMFTAMCVRVCLFSSILSCISEHFLFHSSYLVRECALCVNIRIYMNGKRSSMKWQRQPTRFGCKNSGRAQPYMLTCSISHLSSTLANVEWYTRYVFICWRKHCMSINVNNPNTTSSTLLLSVCSPFRPKIHCLFVCFFVFEILTQLNIV